MRGVPENLTGRRFGWLTVVERAPKRAGDMHRKWLCQCECGKTIEVFATNLRDDSSTSCGCRYGSIGDRTRLHGASRTPTYWAWKLMRERCLNPKSRKYPLYGGRGITVCDRWSDFAAFIADMGPRPEGMTLDRKDVNGPYSPENCRWATHEMQANNKRTTRYITFDGVTLSLSQWARLVGIPREKIRDRLDNSKWPVWKALGFTSDASLSGSSETAA